MNKFTQKDLKVFSENCSQKIIDAKGGLEYFEEPFKHIVIDNFFDPAMAYQCLSSFPFLEDDCWEKQNDADIEVKWRTTWDSEFDIPDGLVDAVRVMNSSLFLKAMAERMGIPKIIPDPYFTGGGLNVTLPGGLLDVHVDGNYHDATGLNRRLNAILYLNPGWDKSWGGEFGIYDDKGMRCVKKIAPLHNRLVIFDSHDFSFHGLPNPIHFPKGECRKSIILYYYTKDSRPSNQVLLEEPHSALWVKKDLKDKKGRQTREFK